MGEIIPIRSAAFLNHPVVPADAVTASASGLDPDISPAYADIQVAPGGSRARDQRRPPAPRWFTTTSAVRCSDLSSEPMVKCMRLDQELDRASPLKS